MAHDDLPFTDAVDPRPVDARRACCAGAARAGCEALVRIARRDVHVDRLVREDGVVLTWFVSYADEAIGPARPA
jgi:hypothetical protein